MPKFRHLAHPVVVRPFIKSLLLLLVSFYILNTQVSGQNLILDDTFTGSASAAAAYTYVSSVQPDGKILVGGRLRYANGTPRGGIARLNPDGTEDTTFNPGGTGAMGGAFFSTQGVYDIVVLNDGKILIAGGFFSYNGIPARGLARLNSDGTLDTSFNVGGTGVSGTYSLVKSIAVQSDGKIIAGGFGISGYNGVLNNAMFRVNSDGTIDNSFISGFTSSQAEIDEIAIQSDGRIVMALDSPAPYVGAGGGFPSYLMRINSDASYDAAFSNSVQLIDPVFGVAIQSDGKIVICGSFTSYNGTSRPGIARVNTNATIDTSFSPQNITNGTFDHVAIQSNGMIVVSGTSNPVTTGFDRSLIRLNADGTTDASLNGMTDGYGYHLTVQPDQKILLVGQFSKTSNGENHNAIVRYNEDGTVDSSFNASITVQGSINEMVQQPDGKIIVAGNFTRANGATKLNLARFNTDGSVDNTFSVGLGPLNWDYPYPPVNGMAVQTDGKILVVGRFTSFNGLPKNHMVRLNADGSVDNSFTLGVSLDASQPLFDVVALPDGKSIIGGNVLRNASGSLKLILRLNSDGSVDNTFNSNFAGQNIGGSYRVILQLDGKIIVSGNFSTYNGVNRSNIVRLNYDGSLDTSFVPATSGGRIAELQSDGKIVTVNGSSFFNNHLVRLNSDGSVDGSFSQVSGQDNDLYTLALQSLGKPLVGGYFRNVDGVSRIGFARLETNGSLDTGFVGGFDSISDTLYESVSSILKVDNNRLFVAGEFSKYNGQTRNNLLRLIDTGPTPTTTPTLTASPTITATYTPTNTVTPTVTATSTPLPAVSGTVTYGNAFSGPPPPRFVSNVTLTGTGPSTIFTTTIFPSGNYSLSGFGAGSYTVTPSKTGGINGSITSFDAARIAQHVAGISLLTGNQFVVADVSGNGTLSSFDAGQVAKYVAGISGFGSTASWKFNPVNRTYALVTTNISGEDYSALLMGEVSGNWANTGARESVGGRQLAEGSIETAQHAGRDARVPAGGGIAVELPLLSGSVDKEVVVPVSVRGISNKGVISYEFDLRYDASVMQPDVDPVDIAGTVSRGLTFVTNAQQSGVLRVVAYGSMPIDEDGLLLNIRFTAVGNSGSVSPLALENFIFNEGLPMTTTYGQVELR